MTVMDKHTTSVPGGPSWVPSAMLVYVAHRVYGRPMRALAREALCHPSTISRRIARWEQRRCDPLINDMLSGLSSPSGANANDTAFKKGQPEMSVLIPQKLNLPDTSTFEAEARRILRRLSEAGAVLAITADMEKGVIVRETQSGTTMRTAVVERHFAQALAVKDWITSSAEGRISRYRITAAGRVALGKLLAKQESAAGNLSDESTPFVGVHRVEAVQAPRRKPVNAETPLMILARRRERDGSLFLSTPLIAAAERLREDYELAQLDLGEDYNWEGLLSGQEQPVEKHRATEALAALGAGLGHVTLRSCCRLEGLESAESALGWSARSGKVVLRIALERLAQFYAGLGQDAAMIG